MPLGTVNVVSSNPREHWVVDLEIMYPQLVSAGTSGNTTGKGQIFPTGNA